MLTHCLQAFIATMVVGHAQLHSKVTASAQAGHAAVPMETISALGALLENQSLATGVAAHLRADEADALLALGNQAIRSGIDYATLGLGWDHPQMRLDYRQARGASFTHVASVRRQARSREALVALCEKIVAAAMPADGGAMRADPEGSTRNGLAEKLIVDTFCAEIGAERLCASAVFSAVAAALAAELLLPLRALNEGIESMTRTFNGAPVPRAPVQKVVDDITANVIAGTFDAWRYGNEVGRAQLSPLTPAQISAWQDPSSTEIGPGLRVHEDAPGELGLFWATKIGGPSHGFDVEGQCLLPLLANARHKVILVSDAAWPAHPAGRAHFRLLWTAETTSVPVLWLETVNVDFAASSKVDSSRWHDAVLGHAVRKAERIGAFLSVDAYSAQALKRAVANVPRDVPEIPGDVVVRADRLVLRPSNGVLEASDYLSNEHDWVQMEEQVTRPLRRAVYVPQSIADKGKSEL